eukprot:scaffold73759_cov28-Prasinocladus_malaysianus.AAC.1
MSLSRPGHRLCRDFNVKRFRPSIVRLFQSHGHNNCLTSGLRGQRWRRLGKGRHATISMHPRQTFLGGSGCQTSTG